VCNRYAHLDRDPEKSARTYAYLTVSMTMQAGTGGSEVACVGELSGGLSVLVIWYYREEGISHIG